jgi:hypothetical protein
MGIGDDEVSVEHDEFVAVTIEFDSTTETDQCTVRRFRRAIVYGSWPMSG